MTVKQRVKEYVKYKDISIREFEKLSGLNYGYVNSIRVSIQPEKLKGIASHFSDLNTEWLLTGKGEMIKNEIYMDSENIINENGVPYYENIDVSASITTMFNDNKETPTFYIDYQHFNDCTAYLPVVGDSMYPRYASGEIVAVKQIFNKDIIQWGEAYLIVCNDNADSLRTIKLVHPCEKDETKIILRASNPNYKGDTPISKDDIISMFIVKGKITRNQL